MTRKPLPFNDQAVTKFAKDCIKAGRGSVRRVVGVPGLNVVVKPGSDFASYVVRYQVGKGAKSRAFRKQVIGRHGVMLLTDARSKALELMQSYARGEDPIQRVRDAALEVKAKEFTFRELFKLRYETETLGKTPGRTLEDYRYALEADAFPDIGDLPVGEITADHLVPLLERAEARSKYLARRLRVALSSTYRWGVQRRKVKANPVSGLGFNVKSPVRRRPVSDGELAKLWAAFDSPEFHVTEPTRIALKLIVLTAQRGGEIMGAHASELQLDGPAPKWVIPYHRMKRKDGDDQIVPLSAQAVGLFNRARELAAARGSEYVFVVSTGGRPGNAVKQVHMCREGVTRAMRAARELAGVANIRNHDMRKVVTTWLGERQERGEVLDMILHHTGKGVTGLHYNHATLEGPMRSALQRWADHVWQITGQAVTPSNVVPMKVTA